MQRAEYPFAKLNTRWFQENSAGIHEGLAILSYTIVECVCTFLINKNSKEHKFCTSEVRKQKQKCFFFFFKKSMDL